jgi:NitT/TauT family transport system substrate-binding protein
MRCLGQVFAAVMLLTASVAAHADDAPSLKFLLTTTSIEPGHATISSLQQSPGFWKQQGLNVQTFGVEGSSLAVQQVASGNADFASVGPEILLAAREHKLPLVAFYAIVPHTIFRLMVPVATKIETAADLKGATIGIPATASASYPFSRAIVQAAGLNPDKDVSWLTVGAGAQAALALQRGQIQAMAGWDTMQASFENRGMAFRDITEPFVPELIGQVLVTREDMLAKHPDIAIKLARGIAEATMYALAYPEATLKNHWRLYPQSKPRQGSEEEMVKAGIAELNSRVAVMQVADWPRTPYGFIDPASFATTAEMTYHDGQVTDRSILPGAYTNALNAEINHFDRAAVLDQKIAAP